MVFVIMTIYCGVAAIVLLLDFRAAVEGPDGVRGGGPVASAIVAFIWPVWVAVLLIVIMVDLFAWLLRGGR
jgi:hypothetical protein